MPSQIKVDLIFNLSLASGDGLGMVAGQALTWEGEHQHLSLEELSSRPFMPIKTGKLLSLSLPRAAIIAELAPETSKN